MIGIADEDMAGHQAIVTNGDIFGGHNVDPIANFAVFPDVQGCVIAEQVKTAMISGSKTFAEGHGFAISDINRTPNQAGGTKEELGVK